MAANFVEHTSFKIWSFLFERSRNKLRQTEFERKSKLAMKSWVSIRTIPIENKMWFNNFVFPRFITRNWYLNLIWFDSKWSIYVLIWPIFGNWRSPLIILSFPPSFFNTLYIQNYSGNREWFGSINIDTAMNDLPWKIEGPICLNIYPWLGFAISHNWYCLRN